MDYWSIIAALGSVLFIITFLKFKFDILDEYLNATLVIFWIVFIVIGLFIIPIGNHSVEYDYIKYKGVIVDKETHLILEEFGGDPFKSNDMHLYKNQDNLCYERKIETNLYGLEHVRINIKVCPEKSN